MISQALMRRILRGYQLPLNGFHGVVHWARVLENGLALSEQTGAKSNVVELFAVFHDSRRVNEGWDAGHGRRGADLAAELRSEFDLSDADFDLLYTACADHTEGYTEADVTIQTCWDSDRLDLGRVGMHPERKYLCTPEAKHQDMIRWAHGRACMAFVPELVTATWNLRLCR